MVKKIFFLILFILLLSSCAEERAKPVTSLQVIISDENIRPFEARVVSLEKITIQVTNQGSIPHGWYLLSEPMDFGAKIPDEGTILFGLEAAPGETVSGSFTAPSPGEYEVVSLVNGERQENLPAILLAFQPGFPP
jgi:hypothetical protein